MSPLRTLQKDKSSILRKKQLFFFKNTDEYQRFLEEELKIPKGSKSPLSKGVKNIMLYIPRIYEGKLCTIMNCAEYICHLDNPRYQICHRKGIR